MSASQRFNPNNLHPLDTGSATLESTLQSLRSAVVSGVGLTESNRPIPSSSKHENLYTGSTGIALTYLRLLRLSSTLGLPADLVSRLPALAKSHLPHLHHHRVSAGHLSPIGTHVGLAYVELLRQLLVPEEDADGERQRRWRSALDVLTDAVQTAGESEEDGGDEVLYGRAGLLWAVLSLKQAVSDGAGEGEGEEQERRRVQLGGVVGEDTVTLLMDRIVEAGKRGSELYGAGAMPLMWSWHGKYYLGAMHGTAGILTVLLHCPAPLLTPHIHLLLPSLHALLTLASANTGHLPSSLPARPRPHPYVQLCHGTPGLLLLLSTLRSLHPSLWSTHEKLYSRAMEECVQVLWTQGLVRKGLGVCHGVAGNGWVLVLAGRDGAAATATEGADEGRRSPLGVGLSMLLHSTGLPPLSAEKLEGSAADVRETGETGETYGVPDHPWSLFEGVAGAVMAWAEVAVVVMDMLDGGAGKTRLEGIPGLGGA